jgi:site-specific recombinase XerD
MADALLTQRTITEFEIDDHLLAWIEGFLLDKKARRMAGGTLRFYQQKLFLFVRFCDSQLITKIAQLTPDVLRRFLLWLEQAGHNPGGVHAAYRALRAFLLWFEAEVEPEGWRNPIRKVHAPRVAIEPLEPVALDVVAALLNACQGENLTAIRDKALLLFLLDTGARAAEVCALDLADIDQVTGSVLIRCGKGGKPRIVRLGQKSRRAFRRYLRQRTANSAAAWLTDDGNRLTYDGLRAIITRRSKLAGVRPPSLHSFRRAFAINFLRNGGDIYSLQRLLGHADLQVLRRYLAQTEGDILAAHARSSPVDNWH